MHFIDVLQVFPLFHLVSAWDRVPFSILLDALRIFQPAERRSSRRESQYGTVGPKHRSKFILRQMVVEKIEFGAFH